MAFTTAFQMEEMDNKAYIIELQLELANLKQEKTKNIIKFIAKINVLAREFPHSQVDIGMIVTQGILDPKHKKKLLFKYAKSKNFAFSNVKTLFKAIYFF